MISTFHCAGCAFVMFATREAAVDAQKNLHEKKTLPGVSSYREREELGRV